MQSGIICLDPLYAYIRRHKEIPHKKEKAYIFYNQLRIDICRSIPDVPGWYAWIQSKNGLVKILYVGQSQARKTAHIKARIMEELLDEYVSLWATVWDFEETVNTLIRKELPQYATLIRRAARKSGTTHIIWFGRAGLTDIELTAIECQLIKKYDPPANLRKPKQRDSYPELFAEAEAALQGEITKLLGLD